MEITEKLGQTVVHEVGQYTNVDINIMNLLGIIVSSTDKKRINTMHSGSKKVIQTGQALTIDESNKNCFPGTKVGINSPVMHLGKIRGVVGVSGTPEEVVQVSGLIRASVEIVLQQIFIQRQEHFKEREWNNWLQQLLHPEKFNEYKLRNEAEYLFHLETEKMWRVIIVKGEGIQNSIELIRRKINELKISANFTLPFLDQEVVLLVPATFRRIVNLINEIKNQYSLQIQAGVGDANYGLKGIRVSYFQAKQALDFEKDGALISFSDQWKVKRLISSISEEEYNHICTYYERLLTKLGDEFLQTIDVYMENDFSIKQTACSLHIHRNTLLYRLNQIKKKVKLDPRSFHDAFLLKIIRTK